MSFKVVVSGAILVALLCLMWWQRKIPLRAFRRVGRKHGLEVGRSTLDGTMQDRAIHARRVQKRSGRFPIYALRFEVELRSPPDELRIATEGAISTLAKFAGLTDICVGDEGFDAEFLIRCTSDEPALVWLSAARREALMALHQVVDDVRIEEGFLEFELPADPSEADELEKALTFAVEIAERIDDPIETTHQPALEIRGLRARRGKWDRLISNVLLGIPLLAFGGAGAFCLFVLVPQITEENAREEARRERAGGLLTSCLRTLELTWDVDVSVCADAAAATDPELSGARFPLKQYNELLLRKAERVDLDPAAAAAAIKGIFAASTSPDRQLDQLRHTWDAGLPTEYAALETWDKPAFEPTARAVATLGGMADRIDRMPALEVPAVAAKCLLRVEPGATTHRTSMRQVLIACQAVTSQDEGDGRSLASVNDDDNVARLEADPDARRDARIQSLLEAVERSPKTALYVAALELAHGTNPRDLPLEAIAEVAAPARCEGAWAPGDSFGDPEIWREAARVAGPALADIMRTHAIAQDHVMGRFEVLEGGLQTKDPTLATCVAQMEIAAGAPAAALARLDGLEPASEPAPWVHYTRAQAHFIQRQWGPAATQAVAALQGLPITPENRSVRAGAALLAIAAQFHVPDPEVESVLEQFFGPRPTIDQLRDDDAVGTARWFTDPAREDFPDADVRWGAPASLPLVQGAEVASFHIAGEFARDANVEYWLDTLAPFEFDPFGVATGRLLAAKLRDDAAAEKSWEVVQARLRALVDSPSAARLRRHAFP